MSFEDLDLDTHLRDDLHRAAAPPGLAPPADLAGLVLGDLRRQRRVRMLVSAVAAVAVMAVIAVIVPGLFGPDGGTGSEVIGAEPGSPSSLPFPTPGGGPQAIHCYTTTDNTFRTFLLDLATGDYLEYPFEHAVLSPDLSMVAVVTEDGPGVVERTALIRNGMSAIRLIDRPAFGRPAWSPDGSAVLFTSIENGNATAHRYDVDTGRVTDTPINVDLLGNSVGWAADSRRYLVPLRGEQNLDTVEPGPLQYIEPDGTLGERIEIQGGVVRGAESYSPSWAYLLVDPSDIASAQPVPASVLEVETGDVVTTLPGGRSMPVGWYDDTTVAQLVRDDTGEGTLQLVDIATGEVTEQIALRGLPRAAGIQIGSSAGLTGPAEESGF